MSSTEARDPAVEPTPAQWVDDFLAGTRAEQVAYAERARDAFRTSARCWQQMHEDHIERLEHEAIGLSGDVASAKERLAAARAEVARLRSALERTERNFILAVHNKPVRDMAENLAENAAALAPVVPSGEAASGTGDPAAQRLLRDIFGEHDDDTPAPVSSGGQADGEGVRLRPDEIERLDFNYQVGDGRWLYQEVEGIIAGRLAARPVLSREALRERLVERLLRDGLAEERQGYGHATADEVADAMLDVLAGEQR